MIKRPMVAAGLLLTTCSLLATSVIPSILNSESSARDTTGGFSTPHSEHKAQQEIVTLASVKPLLSTKPPIEAKPLTSTHQHQRLSTIGSPKLEATAVKSSQEPAAQNALPTQTKPGTQTETSAPHSNKWAKHTGTTPSSTNVHTIKSGDSMAKLFQRQALSPQTLHTIMTLGKKSKKLADLRPGQQVEFALDHNKELLGLTVQLDALNTLWVTKNDSSAAANYIIDIEKRSFDKRVSSAHGIIDNSLFLAGQQEGLSEKLIMEFANIFGWDIDFALDIRVKDTFSVLYEENMLDGKKHSDGAILAAEFTNAGKTFTAIRYEQPNGRSDYYTKDGYSLRKAFLRSPVDFARISSHFNLRRRHPILHTIRAHKGVDYAASRGTPIKAIGDGKVILAGRKGGYGKTVILQHGQKYTTLYAHLHRYAKGIRNGSRVSQGQVIGYVGSSGLATGPHLHYEFRTNGVHVNPLTVAVPKSDPIPKSYRQDFAQHAASLLAQLPMSNSQTRYASQEGGTTIEQIKKAN